MALLAERLPAREALAAGLIADVYPTTSSPRPSTPRATSRRRTVGAFHFTKDAVNDATLIRTRQRVARERSGQIDLLAAADFQEGVAAFLEKRPAVFGRA